MLIKKIFGKLHLILGLTSGLVVFIVSVTGCLYAFEEEIRNALHKDVLYVEVGSNRKSIADLVKNAKAEFPKPPIKNIRINADPKSSVEIILKNKQSIFVDPYSGKVLGTFNKEEDILGILLQVHRSLYLGDVGKIITGTSATIFVFMLISGIILWWPKNKALLKQKLRIEKKAGKKRRNYDLHSVLGFYAAWVIIFTALTGMVWSFKWVENTMYWVNNSKMERQEYHSEYVENKKKITIDEVIKRTGSLYRNSDGCFIQLPQDSIGIYKITLRYDAGGFYKKMDQLIFDQYSGKLIQANLFENSSQGDKLKATNYGIHTGKVFGLVGQIIVFLAALISASLPVTGFLMWRAKRKKHRKPDAFVR